MASCNIQRHLLGSTAQYRVEGKFEGSCAWELAGQLESEALANVQIDFSQTDVFVDYGVAVLASCLQALPKKVELRGLRQHQERLFRYFGVDTGVRSATLAAPAASVLFAAPPRKSEVA